MMYFHATVPRKWLGSHGCSVGERVRHVNTWEKGEWGKGQFVFLKHFSVNWILNLNMLALYCLRDEYNVFDMQSH